MKDVKMRMKYFRDQGDLADLAPDILSIRCINNVSDWTVCHVRRHRNHRDTAGVDYCDSITAHKYLLQTRSPLRSHNDKIDSIGFGKFFDFFLNGITFHGVVFDRWAAIHKIQYIAR